MQMNLVLATGLAYSIIGALIVLVSHRALYNRATRIVAGYPRVLALLRIQKHDARCGLVILISGHVLQVMAAIGYSMPMSYWRYSAAGLASALIVYGIWRLIARWWLGRRRARSPRARAADGQVYETRRSVRLLEAARREAANRRVRELAKVPRNRSVVFIAQEWECRWWSDKLGVTPDALRAAVRHVGPMISDIERYFGLRSRIRYARAA